MDSVTFPPVNYQKLSHNQLYQMSRLILGHWNDQAQIPPIISLLLTDIDEYSTALLYQRNAKQGSVQTGKLEELDEMRDRLYRLMIKRIKLGKYELEDETIQASERLLHIVNQFAKSVPDLPYALESSTITNILSFFRMPDFARAVRELNLEQVVDKLEESNAAFKALEAERASEKEQKSGGPSIRATRDALSEAIRLLLTNTLYFYTKNHPSVDPTLLKNIEKALKHEVAVVKSRATRAKNRAKKAIQTSGE